MEKFTKGEWIVYPSDSFVEISAECGSLIYNRDLYHSTTVEQMANAHLIAAAPKMYKMLNNIMKLSNGDMGNLVDGMLCYFDEIEDLLKEARIGN